MKKKHKSWKSRSIIKPSKVVITLIIINIIILLTACILLQAPAIFISVIELLTYLIGRYLTCSTHVGGGRPGELVTSEINGC